MANVNWSTGIDSVSGALAKVSKNAHSCKKMLLATHRVAPTQSRQCNRLYLRPKPKGITRLTADIIMARQRFAAIARATNARLQNLQTLTADQQAFLAQKDSANGKKTLRAYIWQLETISYDNAHS